MNFYDPRTADNSSGYKIKSGLLDKVSLINELAKLLNFPEYCQTNWDSLEECLCDLEYKEDEIVSVYHLDLPLPSDELALKIYLSILETAEHETKVRFYFPNQYREYLESLEE